LTSGDNKPEDFPDNQMTKIQIWDRGALPGCGPEAGEGVSSVLGVLGGVKYHWNRVT